jgi:hypothetical protein
MSVTWKDGWRGCLGTLAVGARVRALIVVGLVLPWIGRAQVEDRWIRRDPVNVNLNGVAYGLNRFLAVGDFGYWFTSPNGQTWTTRAPITDGNLEAVHFAHGHFVAVGDGIYTSGNGVSWEKAALAYSRLFLSDVAADDAGNWLAVGRVIEANGSLGSGITFTSPDGVNWTRASLLGAPAKIAFGVGQWFGAGTAGSEGQEFGEQLLQWRDLNNDPGSPAEWGWSPFFLDDFELLQPKGALIRFLNGRFVLAGKNVEDEEPTEAHHVYTSTDGVNWPKGTVSNQGLPENGFSQPRFSFMRDLAYGDGIYVGIAAGNQSFNSDYWSRTDMMTSTDGQNWAFLADRTSLVAASNRALIALAHANGQFVAVGYRGTSPLRLNLATTPDGSAWTSRSFNPAALPSGELLRALTTGNGLVLGVSNGGSAVISQDHGISWAWAEITATQGARDLYGVASGGDRFVAVGSGGRAHRSTDGFSWSSVLVPDAFWLWDIIHDGAQFVAAGQYRDAGNTVQRGIVSRSTDGAIWTTVQLDGTSRIEDLAHGNGVYVGVGGLLVAVSSDAIDWTLVNGAPQLSKIAFGGGRFLGVSGDPGHPQFHTSVDGGEWVLIETADEFFFTPFFEVESLTHLNGHFAMGTSDMGVLFLDESDRWAFSGGPDRAAAVAFSEDTYVATSLWTYRLPEPEPPLEPPVLTWERNGDQLRLLFPTRLEHRYWLWQRTGLGAGSQWFQDLTFVADTEEGNFEVFIAPWDIEPKLFRISVEPPGTGF